ncbi:MAG: RNA polymerase sigma factor, partial [Gemmataceae bacterium]
MSDAPRLESELERLARESPAEWAAFTRRMAAVAADVSRRVLGGASVPGGIDADDLAGEVLINVWRKPDVVIRLFGVTRGDDECPDLWRYLTVVARNRAMDERRRWGRHREVAADYPGDASAHGAAADGPRHQEESFLLTLEIALDGLSAD